MKAIKRHDTTYTALHHCLEAHFGNHNTARISRVTTLARSATHSGNDWKYREPEQGFRTIPFQSLPLKLNYMRRRTNKPRLRRSLG